MSNWAKVVIKSYHLIQQTSTPMEDSIRKSFPGSVAKHAGRGKLPSSLIDHTYYDYSALDIKEIEDFRGETCTGNNPKQKKSTFLSFPMKLHKIVSDPKYHDIIRWMPHGRAWNIYDKEKLKEICKEHFKHGSFESFNRSVNGWGFKVSTDSTMIVWYIISHNIE